jgi:hypothetical protein
MEETSGRTVSASRAVTALALVAAMLVGAAGCSGRYARPRTLASLGGLAVAGGSAAWAVGENYNDLAASNRTLVTAGFVTVAVGLAALVAAGGWMATSVSCNADPDCDEEEQCREIPAPPGGIPYKQCMSR